MCWITNRQTGKILGSGKTRDDGNGNGNGNGDEGNCLHRTHVHGQVSLHLRSHSAASCQSLAVLVAELWDIQRAT